MNLELLHNIGLYNNKIYINTFLWSMAMCFKVKLKGLGLNNNFNVPKYDVLSIQWRN